MKGANAVIGFGLFSIVALLLLSTLSPWNGFCGEKPIGRCPHTVIADTEPVINASVVGLLGLLVLMLAANVCLWLLRRHRSVG